MLRHAPLTALALVLGVVIGYGVSYSSASPGAQAQGPGHVLADGHGRAISSVQPPDSELFSLTASNAPRRSFKVVPAGKKFVITDVMYLAQDSVKQKLVVNVANAYPALKKQDILFQVALSPGESDQVHLCSGYVIPAGNAIVAFTNANLEPEQYVSVSVTGYLADE